VHHQPGRLDQQSLPLSSRLESQRSGDTGGVTMSVATPVGGPSAEWHWLLGGEWVRAHHGYGSSPRAEPSR
jgi:hypothetical protein